MESAAARGSHVGFSPSILSHWRVPPKSFSAGPSGFLCRRRRQRTPLPLLRAAYTLDSHNGDGPVDVIGIGSRKDSIIDFCLASPAVSASRFRFWTIYSRDQKKVQLLERCHSKDVFIRNVEFPLAPHSCLPATILVASAGHDLDQIAAVDLLCSVKSVGGLVIAIVLKPFSFEGQRRQKEAHLKVENWRQLIIRTLKILLYAFLSDIEGKVVTFLVLSYLRFFFGLNVPSFKSIVVLVVKAFFLLKNLL